MKDDLASASTCSDEQAFPLSRGRFAKVVPHHPLPWINDPTGDCGDQWIGRADIDYFLAVCDDCPDDIASEQNARYIVHAANAYPKLVEALRRASATFRRNGMSARHPIETLLHELGELS